MARKKYDIPRLPRAEKAHRRQLEAITAGEWKPFLQSSSFPFSSYVSPILYLKSRQMR
jgi:hypothetical protein